MYLRLAVAAVISIVLAGAGWKCYVMGKQAVQREWDAERAAQAIAAAEAAKKAQQTADTVAEKVAQSARQDRVVYRTIYKESARVANDCPASADFRLLHDAAATASVPDSGPARTDAAAVPAQVVAETVIENYEGCRDNARRLEALQDIIRAYNGE